MVEQIKSGAGILRAAVVEAEKPLGAVPEGTTDLPPAIAAVAVPLVRDPEGVDAGVAGADRGTEINRSTENESSLRAY